MTVFSVTAVWPVYFEVFQSIPYIEKSVYDKETKMLFSLIAFKNYDPKVLNYYLFLKHL